MTQTPKLTELLCFSLYSTSLVMNKLYRKLLAPLNLTYPQYLVLVTLWQEGNITVSEIGKHLYLDSATLTPLLKRMEKIELIVRQRASKDQRQVIVSLGPKGIALKSNALNLFESVGCAVNFSMKELEDMKSLLHSLRENLLKNT